MNAWTSVSVAVVRTVCYAFVADLLYSKLYDQATTDRRSGLWEANVIGLAVKGINGNRRLLYEGQHETLLRVAGS